MVRADLEIASGSVAAAGVERDKWPVTGIVPSGHIMVTTAAQHDHLERYSAGMWQRSSDTLTMCAGESAVVIRVNRRRHLFGVGFLFKEPSNSPGCSRQKASMETPI